MRAGSTALKSANLRRVSPFFQHWKNHFFCWGSLMSIRLHLRFKFSSWFGNTSAVTFFDRGMIYLDFSCKGKWIRVNTYTNYGVVDDISWTVITFESSNNYFWKIEFAIKKKSLLHFPCLMLIAYWRFINTLGLNGHIEPLTLIGISVIVLFLIIEWCVCNLHCKWEPM